MMTRRMYWGLAILMILFVGVTAVLRLRDVDTEPITIYKVPPDEQVKSVVLKKPPSGENFMTGHWQGDVWHRTAPPAPETVTVDEEILSYEELLQKVWGPMKNHQRRTIIAEYPYSEAALQARYYLTGGYSFNKARKLSALKEMLKYHSDSPRLLADIVSTTMYMDGDPEEAIKYGKEALKYVDLYPSDSLYGLRTHPEDIHHDLGIAYQKVGDYKSALVHLKAASELIEANPDRARFAIAKRDRIHYWIERIEAGRPSYGPPEPEMDYSGLEEIELTPIDFDSHLNPLPLIRERCREWTIVLCRLMR